VTRPLRYNTVMTKRRVFFIILFVWLISLIVSLAPQIGWKSPQTANNTCEVNEDMFYALFSASVSYYIPLIIILFVYFRVYKEATAQMRFLTTGTKRIGSGDRMGSITLRVHRGPTTRRDTTPLANSQHRIPVQAELAAMAARQAQAHRPRRCTCHLARSSVGRRVLMPSSMRRSISEMEIDTSASNTPETATATEHVRLLVLNKSASFHRDRSSRKNTLTTSYDMTVVSGMDSIRSKNLNESVDRSFDEASKAAPSDERGGEHVSSLTNRIRHLKAATSSENVCALCRSCQSEARKGGRKPPEMAKEISSYCNRPTHGGPLTNRIAKFKREQKAAKTLAIVVGCLIVCWMPFFVILPLGESFQN
jgi:hypothetical protein